MTQEESDEAESDEEKEGLRRQYFDEGDMSDDFVDLDTDYEVHRQAREADAALAKSVFRWLVSLATSVFALFCWLVSVRS